MAEQKIKHSDLFEGDVFKPTQQGAENLLKTIEDLKSGFKELLSTTKSLGSSPLNNSEDITKLNKALAENESLRGELLKLQVAEKETRANLKKLTDEQIADNKIEKANTKDRIDGLKAEKIASDQLAGTLQKLEAANTKLRLERKKLNLDTKEGQTRLKEINSTLDANNKKIRESNDALGKQKINIGNYKSALEGLPGPLGEATQGVSNLGQQFLKLLANPIVLLIAAIVAALYGLVKAFQSTDTGANKFASIMEQISAIIDVARQRAALMAKAIGDIFTGDWDAAASKFNAAVSGAGDQLERATAAAREYVYALDALEDAENNYISNAAEARNKIAKLEFDAADRSKTIEQRRDALLKVLELSREEVDQEKKFAAQRLKIEAEKLAGLNNLTGQEVLSYIKLNDAEQERASASLKLARDNNEEKFTELEKLYEKFIDTDTKYFEQNKRNNAKLTSFDEQVKKEREESQKKATEAREKEAREKLKLEDDLAQARIRNIQNERLREIEAEKQALSLKLRDIKGNTELENQLRAELQKESNNKVLSINKSYREKENKEAEEFAEKQRQIQSSMRLSMIEVKEREKEANDKIAKDDEERRKKQKEDAAQQAQDLIKIADDALKVQADKRKEASEEEINQRKTNIDRQQELAEKGLDNQLAFEKQKLAEAELKKREDQERAIRQQKVIAYINSFAEYAKRDPDTAPFKALAAVAIGEAIAGAFKDGVENLDGPGTDTSDSILALLSKGESVATAKGTRENPGLVTAMNKGTVDEWVKENYIMPQMGMLQPVKVDQQISVQELRNVKKEIKNLTEVLRNKKEIDINWDSHGNMIRKEIEDGVRRTVTLVKAKPRI